MNNEVVTEEIERNFSNAIFDGETDRLGKLLAQCPELVPKYKDDLRTIGDAFMTPIYTEERDLEQFEGAPALMRAFDRSGISFIYQPDRPNVSEKH